MPCNSPAKGIMSLYFPGNLSATRSPPAPSIIQFRGGQHWFQLGMHNPQRTTRAASHFRYRASLIQSLCRAHGGPTDQLRVSMRKLPRRTNSAIASAALMSMANRACAYRRYIPAGLGEVPQKRPAPKRQRAPVVPGLCLQLRGHAHIRAAWKQINHSFNHVLPMCAIMYSCCHECIHVPYLRGAPIYYSFNYTFKTVLHLSTLSQKR